MGPLVYVKHLISEARLPFTAAYLGSIGMTLYSAVGVRFLHTLPTLHPCSSSSPQHHLDFLWYAVGFGIRPTDLVFT